MLIVSIRVEMVVHGVKNGSDFNKEGGLKWPGVEDVFFHHDGFFIGLKEDEEVGPEQFIVEMFMIGHVLMFLEALLLHKRFGVDNGTVDSGDRHDFEPLLE